MEPLTILHGQHEAHVARFSTYAANNTIRLLERAEVRLTAQIHELLEGLTAREVQAFLRSDYSTRRLVKLREAIQSLTAQTRKQLADNVKQRGKELAAYELGHVEKLIAINAGADIAVGVTSSQAYSAAVSRPMLGVHIRDHLKEISTDYRREVFREIRLGYLASETPAQILRRLKGSAPAKYRDGKIFKRNQNIERTIKTSMNHFANVARAHGFRDLGVKELIHVSVLDGKTSKECAALDGKVYPIDRARFPPIHPNCRSLLQAYFGKRGGTRQAVASTEFEKLSKAEKKKAVRNVRGSTNYEKFLAGSSVKFQKDYLGPTRYKLWKSGNYKLKDLVDNTGREYTIIDLRAKDAQTFKELGL